MMSDVGGMLAKAFDTMSGESVDDTEEAWSSKRYLDRADQRYEQAAAVVSTNRVDGINNYISAMLYYLASIVEESRYGSEQDNMKAALGVFKAVSETDIKLDKILSIVSDNVSGRVSVYSSNVMEHAVHIYRYLHNESEHSEVPIDWVTAAKDGADVAKKLRVLLNVDT